jgi:TPR repeat protein
MHISRYIIIAIAVVVFIFDLAFEIAARPLATPDGVRTYAIDPLRKSAPRDLVKEASAYRRAAESGDTDAMFQLAVLFDYDKFSGHDAVQAMRWYRKASDLGNGKAMFTLGVRYWSGRGVRQDSVEAYKWLDLATRRSVGRDQEAASTARAGVARGMSPAMIESGQKLASEWQAAFEKRKS